MFSQLLAKDILASESGKVCYFSGKKTVFTCRFTVVKDNLRQNSHRPRAGEGMGLPTPQDFYKLVLEFLVLYICSSPKNFFKLGLDFNG